MFHKIYDFTVDIREDNSSRFGQKMSIGRVRESSDWDEEGEEKAGGRGSL